ncbi:MAG: DUF5615 family PIN-like protein [Pyrinomonadaceae bacterium]
MKLLLDECVPKRLKNEFGGHEVFTIEQAGFKGLKNGNLPRAAEGEFDVLITVDKTMQHQQTKLTLPLAIVVLSSFSNRFESLLPLTSKALEVLENSKIGEIITISEN